MATWWLTPASWLELHEMAFLYRPMFCRFTMLAMAPSLLPTQRANLSDSGWFIFSLKGFIF